MAATLPACGGVRQPAGQQMATDCTARRSAGTDDHAVRHARRSRSSRVDPAVAPRPVAARRPGGPGDRAAAVRRGPRPRRSSLRTGTWTRACCWRTSRSRDPTSLLLQPDHYVTRLLHANGVSLTDLGVGEGPLPEAQARQAWRLLCANWRVFRGTPVRYWFDSELGEHLRHHPAAERGERRRPVRPDQRAAGAGRLPAPRPAGQVRHRRAGHHRRPRRRSAAHEAIAADPGIATRVIPTFRPDRYLEPAHEGLGGRRQAPRRRRERRRRRVRRATSPPWRSGAVSSSPAAPPPPITATSTPSRSRWNPAEAQAHLLPGDERRGHRRPRRRRSAGT